MTPGHEPTYHSTFPPVVKLYSILEAAYCDCFDNNNLLIKLSILINFEYSVLGPIDFDNNS